MSKSAAEIRREFIEFFEQRGHTYEPGSPVIPYDDPTLLFINAGMNQFKDVFLGAGTRSFSRAANSQPCIRAGGKHNDLDDVGQDTYHHTFFEMLGNWSFGDYFKKEAIEWAWELLTKVWGIDGSRLHATYFEGDESEGLEPDLDAKDLWALVTDINPDHIHPGNKKDNFWEMGETGPCGPCSEIHIDLTPDRSGAELVNAGDARVIEIWNLVFIQYNRDAAGKLTPLPAKHVDTGMGFERVTAVLQGKSSNYDTDVFSPVFEAIQKVTGAPAYTGLMPEDAGFRIQGSAEQPGATLNPEPRTPNPQAMIDVSYRVIADHIRCLTFAINDGCSPDREGRGYVLRRILRRAVRYGWQYLNMHKPFLYKLVPAVVDSLGDAFPQITKKPDEVAEIIRDEEESFGRTLDRGIALFDEAAEYAVKNHHGEIRGEDAFKLHDTYGFPIDLTEIMAEEKGLRVDIGEYMRLMEEARERARGSGDTVDAFEEGLIDDAAQVGTSTDDDEKYSESLRCDAVIRTLAHHGTMDHAQAGESVAFTVDRTCFYVEAGGQISDMGTVTTDAGEIKVTFVRRVGQTIVHSGKVIRGEIHVGSRCVLRVSERRALTMQNHTATHVMNWALREVLGEHVQQKGSLVDPDKTRFDFSNPKALTAEQIERVEQLVNDRIAQNLTVYDEPVPQEEALKVNGLRAVFGEKYPDLVRVLSIGTPVSELVSNPDNAAWRDISIEFCGGTHLKQTGEIEHFAIVGEEAVAKGIRRVVGVTGETAKQAAELGAELLKRAARLGSLHMELAADVSPAEDLAADVAKLQQDVTEAAIRVVDRMKLRDAIADLQKIIKKQHKKDAAAAKDVIADKVAELLTGVAKIGDTTVFVAEMPDVPIDQLKTGADIVKQKCGSAAILFGVWADRPSVPEASAPGQGKALLLAAMTPDLIKRGLKSGDLVKHVAPIVKGGGGGPPTMAQAGGKDPSKIDDALDVGRQWIEEKLA